MTLIMDNRYTIGEALTHHELREAYKAIFQRDLPRGAKSADVARGLAASYGNRFEFEVNRLRGFAWNNHELG